MQTTIQSALDRAPAIVIDEFSQTIEHLAISPFVSRLAVYQEVCRLLREKDVVVLLDADMQDRDIELVKTTVEGKVPVYVYEMPESWADHRFCILPTPTMLVMNICDDLRRGEKVIIASDSKTGVRRLAEQIRAEIKSTDKALASSLRILAIHADNAGDAAQKAFLHAPDAESPNYDLLIYSPSISSGVSLTI